MNLYYNFEAFWGIFELINVIIISIISAIIIYVLVSHKKDKAPIFVLALNLEKSNKQLYLLFIASILLIVFFSMFIFGELIDSVYYIILAQTIALFSYLIISYVIIMWFISFKRFI